MSASTATTVRRVHDADLCEQIKRLERKVAELEKELYSHGPHYYPVYPYWPNPWPRPTIWYGNTTSTGIDNISSTYTVKQIG